MNIAVDDFEIDPGFYSGDAESKAAELKAMIKRGLDFSLYFNVANTDTALMALINKDQFNYDDWIFMGADHLVGGIFSSDGVRYHLYLQIVDILRGKTIYHDRLQSSVDSLNQLSYKTVDRIINILTGETGISRSRIVCSIGRGGAKELYICNWDGSDGHYLTENGSLNLFPASDPDGEYIYFTTYIRGNPDLYRLKLGSSNLDPVSARNGINSSPAVSPDGKMISLTLSVDNNSELYLLNSKGKILRRLTRSWGIESSPSFSPGGNEIVFSSDRSGTVQLYITDIEGLNQRRLTFYNDYNDTPSWSPRGDRIAYASRENGRFQIYTISVTGEQPRRLTDIGNNQDPCFSPDGLHICFISDRDGNNEIYVMNFDGSGQLKITSVKNAYNPCWVSYKEKNR